MGPVEAENETKKERDDSGHALTPDHAQTIFFSHHELDLLIR